ncbi:hypothetical protein M0722_16245 [Microbacterium sp. KSW4-16]|uniref:hypothetical protein n=1 Tax=Microbacterium aurugineum TaxID=2851642 RepID=UPI0020C166B1|nr:hypothetical protein [Microbacterium aurugineum]MCK8468747.1 hypothetical protein [Microbacterium aurugineum]
MKLIELVDPTGKRPSMWVNVNHVVSVVPAHMNHGTGITAAAEVKLEGMPLHRFVLGEYASTEAAEEAFSAFLGRLQAPL